ncbi:MAG: undecaprenyl-phosphate glucose phosphotransferase [Bacteroidetes bacterium]|nr:undecaprenyl-phosphate glucose phosphotransferase [Bacteroidota bacterium]
MAKAYHRYTIIRYIIDTPIVGLSYLLASSITSGRDFGSMSPNMYLFTLIALLVWYISASFSRLYADRRSNKYSEEIIFIIYTIILFTILLSSASFFLKDRFQFAPHFFTWFLGILFFLMSFTKYVIRKYLHSAIYQGKLFDNILIVGSTPSALEYYETINKYYYYGYKCLGFLDNTHNKLNGCHYLGKIGNLGPLLKDRRIDEVVIALPNAQNDEIQQCLEICDYHATKARIIPDLYQYASSTVQVNNIGLMPVISIRSLPLDKLENRVLKRAFDIVFSVIFFLTLGFWLLPLIALAIKLSSKGPAIFKQERWGLNNEKIICYKFRTMVSDSSDIDANGYYHQASKDDPRVTRLGAILRRTNMDELPQFWNVLLGNMSVVGPRPHPTPLNLESMHTVENYMLRHLVNPGITGWAQVNGSRGETKGPGSMQQRVNFDLYYIHRWTFWLDSQIILQTIINIIRGDQNAY